MRGLRAFLLHNRRLAVLLVMLALAMKALVPPGYMVGTSSRALTILVCADSTGARSAVQVTIPQGSKETAAKDHKPCTFAGHGAAALGGADPIQLALALAFVLALGFLAVEAPHLAAARRILPPPCGPPHEIATSIA
ncbi:hypothetical protein [Novosphingobium jiangmenense]|uniref:DUF2946 domain-containing protein n=1 Tax=Novosphingobium jiangmenense TaxID=2791981 RepID=A0ABS0HDY2_9SPHN|nr:hypothetical protein [Novosphingobium jiangmenense]MBF9150472.1 hypothetical protein [Novosphingobium jiangmenense]